MGGWGGDTDKLSLQGRSDSAQLLSDSVLRRKTETRVSVEATAGHDSVRMQGMLGVSPVSGGKWKVMRARQQIIKAH